MAKRKKILERIKDTGAQSDGVRRAFIEYQKKNPYWYAFSATYIEEKLELLERTAITTMLRRLFGLTWSTYLKACLDEGEIQLQHIKRPKKVTQPELRKDVYLIFLREGERLKKKNPPLYAGEKLDIKQAVVSDIHKKVTGETYKDYMAAREAKLEANNKPKKLRKKKKDGDSYEEAYDPSVYHLRSGTSTIAKRLFLTKRKQEVIEMFKAGDIPKEVYHLAMKHHCGIF